MKPIPTAIVPSAATDTTLGWPTAAAVNPVALPAASASRVKARGFARNLLVFTFANVLSLLCNGVLTFLLPRRLTIEDFGYYRLFILYGSFAGVLHCGFLDGALIRWAARPRRLLPREVFPGAKFLLLQHAAILLPALTILLVIFHRRPWFFLAGMTLLYAVVGNLALLGQFALQAEKSFGTLSLITAVQPALLLGMVLARRPGPLTLAELLGKYFAASLLAGAAVWILLRVKFPGKTAGAAPVWQAGARNIGAGWSVMLGGLLTGLALNLDRFAVSFTFGIRDFAVYSLAATALAVLNTIILSVSRVVFPYLSDGLSPERQRQAYNWGESCIVTLWAASLAGYFALRLLIQKLLPVYILSLPILRLLMLAPGFTAVIYILHSNYFRSRLRQRSLLLGAGVGLLSAALFLAIARRSGNLENMPWAMLGSVALWWAVDEWLLRDWTQRPLFHIAKTFLFSAACTAFFLLCALIPNNFVAVLTYLSGAGLLACRVYGSTLRSLPIFNAGHQE